MKFARETMETVDTETQAGPRALARRRARQRILAAARRVFAESGFAAASVARIADEAGFTKGLVHHYFGSKRDLWEQVKEQFGRDAARALSGVERSGSGMDGVEDFIQRGFAFFRDGPDLLRLTSWAELDADYELPPSMLALEQEIDELFHRARADGAIRDDVDPIHARAMIHQLIVGWLQTKRFLCPAWNRDPEGRGTDESYLRDVLTVVRDGLAPRANERRAAHRSRAPRKKNRRR
jgi:AcrR family transcriptional regulator